MPMDGSSKRTSEFYRRIEDLQKQCISDPANVAEVLSDALEELEASVEELSAADEELHQQNEELIKSREALREANEHLEIRVMERTAELQQANRALQEEIEERMRAEAAVKAERKRFFDVLETLPAYLVLLTPDYHVPFANRFFRERFSESHGKRCYEYLFGRSEPCEICETYKVLKTNVPHRWEWAGPDGRNYDIFDFPFTDSDGSSLIMEMGIDITERKQAEIELDKHREHLEELVQERTRELEAANAKLQAEITERKRAEEENAWLASFPQLNPESIIEVDLDGHVNYLNPAAQQLFPDLQECGPNHPWLADWESVAKTLSKVKTRTLIRDVSIGDSWYQQVMYSVPKSQRIRIYGRNITERRRAEDALRETRDYLESLIDYANAPIIVWDTSFGITRFNHAFERLTGFKADEVLGKRLDMLFPDSSRDESMNLIGRTLSGEQWEVKEISILTRDGSLRVVLWNSANICDKDGTKIVATIAQGQDITERKEAEGQLRRARDELEQGVQERTIELQGAKEDMEIANEELQVELEQHRKLEAELIKAKEAAEEATEAKAAFLANMSHELRTPMNAVIGFTSLLLDEPLTPGQKDCIEGIRSGGEALLSLINNILDFSRADKEKVELEHQPFSLKHCIESSFDMVAPLANQKGLNLSYTISYGTPDTIISDPGRLRQILVNLLGNSVKFTDEGEVSVFVSSQIEESDKRKIHFTIKDTGIGIPPEKMEKIFEPFTQVERVISRKRDGVGLGLAISKRLVELMGGKIWAKSVPGRGSSFQFDIQAEADPSRYIDLGKANKDNAVVGLAEQKPLSILVAEDNPSNQRMLMEMLKRMGYRPDAVADGKEVLLALKLRPYDLIFMDVRMPEMDGITATRVIRKLWPEKGPRIVAITAYALEGDREMCLEAGMDDYISKPVQRRDLQDMLLKYSRT